MDTPLISVIVPVYKVEPYLRRCLDSIVNQSYANLQILLVDDGSPDSCGAICDEYADRDSRIQVIHKQNGGLSSARNAALERSIGDWIAYVDSDDWIEQDMFAYLLQNAEEAGADVAVCGHYEDYRNRSLKVGVDCPLTLDATAGIEQLLLDREIHNYVWDKLWKRELMEGIRFPEGRNFEDISTSYRAFEKAGRILCLPEAKYHYIQRSDSIVGNISLKSKLDYYYAVSERRERLLKDYPQFRQLLDNSCMKAVVSIWSAYSRNPKEERKRYRSKIEQIAAFAAEHYQAAIKSGGLGITGRAVLRLTPSMSKGAFWVAGVLSRLYQHKHGRAL